MWNIRFYDQMIARSEQIYGKYLEENRKKTSKRGRK